jgi:hypothetical protein
MSEPSEDAPRIIVDDDWKAQVEKEKQAAAQPAEPSSGETPADQSSEAAARDEAGPDMVPPATLEMLVTMLFTQAMAALGQLPGPDGNMGPVNKPFAKYFIDTVELLGEKTKGNLSEDEAKMISESLHAMRMAFVSVKAKS